MSSCSKGDDDASEQQEAAGIQIAGVSSYITGYGANSQTRAWEPPTGYDAYVLGDQSVGVWFTKDADLEDPVIKAEGYLYKSGEKWRANFRNLNDVKGGKIYNVYGYIPHLPGMSSSITPDEDSEKYADGATLTLTNVPSVMPNDLCVIVGAKDGTDKETVTGLAKGDFAYTTAASRASYYVFLLLDHLYSSIHMNIKVYSDYNALRTIKLKSLKLSTKVDDEFSKDHTDIVIKLKANDADSDPIDGDITYAPTSTAEVNSDGMEFWSSEDGVALTSDFQEFTGHFMPSGITTLELTSVYDVYDKKGNLLRGDYKVTNTMILNELLTAVTETLRGTKYTINMTIQPTYLYVLSEPDLNNPTLVMEP